MKELYIAPELKLLCLAAEERIAAEVEFEDVLGAGGGGPSVIPDEDIEVDLGGLV